MKNKFFNYTVSNIYSKPSLNSEVVSQILYGEKFRILSKKDKWIKIKTFYDKYIGYIKNKKFIEYFKPSHKIFVLKSTIFIKKKNKFYKTNNFLYFASGVSIKRAFKNYLEFESNKWIRKKDTKKIKHEENNFVKILKLFVNSKYLWGGKTGRGIDCSALVQIYFYYNRIFFPRDTKDQIIYCKKKKSKKFSKGDIIFWRGHVGICINKTKFIHAYGPKRKVTIMPIKYAIQLILKTASLKIKKISNLKNF